MKRVFLYIIILYGVLLVASCSCKVEPPVDTPDPAEGTMTPRAEAERTVIVYMVGDNTLSSQVRQDTIEMVRGKEMIPEDVYFVLYIDDKAGKPAIYQLSKQRGMRLCKQYDEELSSTNSKTMLTTLQDIEHTFPARHYGITLWSHATGWVPRRKAFGKDEFPSTPASETEMDIPVLRDVLAQLPRFDYIFFDACFMQCIEVAYELRGVTNYMVGSPAEIPGPGAPYDKIMADLCSGNARGIVEGYDASYPGTYNSFYYPGVLLSCIDCTQLEPLAQATGQYLKPFYMGQTEPSTDDFQPYCDISYETFTSCFDMRTTMSRLLSPDDYDAWMSAFDKAVPLHTLSSTNTWFAIHCNNHVVKDPKNYGGVSMFVPLDKYDTYGWNTAFQKTSWYEALGWAETGW